MKAKNVRALIQHKAMYHELTNDDMVVFQTLMGSHSYQNTIYWDCTLCKLHTSSSVYSFTIMTWLPLWRIFVFPMYEKRISSQLFVSVRRMDCFVYSKVRLWTHPVALNEALWHKIEWLTKFSATENDHKVTDNEAAIVNNFAKKSTVINLKLPRMLKRQKCENSCALPCMASDFSTSQQLFSLSYAGK